MDFTMYIEDWREVFGNDILLCEAADIARERAEITLDVFNKTEKLQQRADKLKLKSAGSDFDKLVTYYEEEEPSDKITEKKKSLIKKVWDKFVDWLGKVGKATNEFIRKKQAEMNKNKDATFAVHKDVLGLKAGIAKFVAAVKNFLHSPCAKAIIGLVASAGAILLVRKAFQKTQNRIIELQIERGNAIGRRDSHTRAVEHYERSMDAAKEEYESVLKTSREFIAVKSKEVEALREDMLKAKEEIDGAVEKYGSYAETRFYAGEQDVRRRAIHNLEMDIAGAEGTIRGAHDGYENTMDILTDFHHRNVEGHNKEQKIIDDVTRKILAEFGEDVDYNPNIFVIFRLMVKHAVNTLTSVVGNLVSEMSRHRA